MNSFCKVACFATSLAALPGYTVAFAEKDVKPELAWGMDIAFEHYFSSDC
jgi:hypothetical protein